MHETAFAERIINEAKKHGTVEEITVELGELAHVPPHDLLMCLKRLVPWKIHCSVKKAMVRCACGYEGEPTILERGHDSFMIECPECKEIPELMDGTEIKLVSVRVN